MNLIDHAVRLLSNGLPSLGTDRSDALTLAYDCPACGRRFHSADSADRVRCRACRSGEVTLAHDREEQE